MDEWVKTTLGQRSWLAERSSRPPAPGISICSFTRLRFEARVASHTWARQTGLARQEFEVVLAEFGEAPTVFPDDASRECFDCYIFAYMPDPAPFALSWWRNVAAWRARAPYAFLLDGDIALAPRACASVLETLHGMPKDRPGAVNPRRLMRGRARVEPGASYDEIAAGATMGPSHEAMWAVDTEAFKLMGGWCEALTGWGEDRFFFDPRARRVFRRAGVPGELFCHVPHQPAPPRPHSRPIRDRCPLFSGAPDHESLNSKRLRGEIYWPIEGWLPGDPCLLDGSRQTAWCPNSSEEQMPR